MQIIKWMFGMMCMICMIPIFFFIVVGPILFFSESIEVYKLGVPRIDVPPGIICFIGIILYASMTIPGVRYIYEKVPILIPFFQMCFLMFAATGLGLFFLNGWADRLMFPKAVALFLTVATYLIVRLFMSYWYYKYPISFKVRK
jgi:hypothetical protein